MFAPHHHNNVLALQASFAARSVTLASKTRPVLPFNCTKSRRNRRCDGHRAGAGQNEKPVQTPARWFSLGRIG